MIGRKSLILASYALHFFFSTAIAADDLGRRSIDSIFPICKGSEAGRGGTTIDGLDVATINGFICAYFVLGFIAHMEFDEIQFKRQPACLSKADLHALNKEVVRLIKTQNPSG